MTDLQIDEKQVESVKFVVDDEKSASQQDSSGRGAGSEATCARPTEAISETTITEEKPKCPESIIFAGKMVAVVETFFLSIAFSAWGAYYLARWAHLPNLPFYLLLVCGPMIIGWFTSGQLAKRLGLGKLAMLTLLESEARRHWLPITVLLAILCFPKLILLWIPTVVIWSLVEKFGKKFIPEHVRESSAFTEFSDGIAQARPFIIFSLYLFCIPFAMAWMGWHWARRLFSGAQMEAPPVVASPDLVSVVQNKRKIEEEEEANFFHSPAFALTCMLVFGCGLPALLTYGFYQFLNVDYILGHPSADANFFQRFVGRDLYLYSFGCCITMFLMRAWFTFPLNWCGDEWRVDLDTWGVRKRTNSWFTQVLTFNSPWSGRDSIPWTEVGEITCRQHCPRLYPLPTTVLDANSFVYKCLNRLALFIDGLSRRDAFDEFIYFRGKEDVNNDIRIRISDLTGDERARLYYALRNWAPPAVLDESVQNKMIGSTVMQAPQYTQMWFDLLTHDMRRKRAGTLAENDQLRDGEFVIKKRLATGGQANVYLAERTNSQEEVVLKEFILSDSDAVGSLIESAGEFETESTLLTHLQHERIIGMIEFFAEDRRLYIALERADGQTLRQKVRNEGPVSETELIEIALQLCDALQYLHEQSPPVVHRDIAPDNIIYSEEKGVKLIDFSLAARKKARRTTSTMGRHCYAAPEQLREQPCPQSDVYGLGATLYFILTGEDPKPITPSDVLAKRPDVSPRLAEIIARATAFELSDRYPDISWLQLEVAAFKKSQI